MEFVFHALSWKKKGQGRALTFALLKLLCVLYLQKSYIFCRLVRFKKIHKISLFAVLCLSFDESSFVDEMMSLAIGVVFLRKPRRTLDSDRDKMVDQLTMSFDWNKADHRFFERSTGSVHTVQSRCPMDSSSIDNENCFRCISSISDVSSITLC